MKARRKQIRFQRWFASLAVLAFLWAAPVRADAPPVDMPSDQAVDSPRTELSEPIASPVVTAQADPFSHLGPQPDVQAPVSSQPTDQSAHPPVQPQDPPPVQPSVDGDAQVQTQPPAKPQDEFYDPFAQAEGTAGQIDEYDPWEPFNQKMFTFNRNLDKYLMRPAAKVWDFVAPVPLQRGISNAFHNIRFFPRLVNNLAQGKFKGAGLEATRFLLNSTFGLGGAFDYARDVHEIVTPDEDTGQTLAVWGVKPGPYLVIPIFGSFTLRDGVGYITDLWLDPFNWLVFPIVKLDGAPRLVTKEGTILWSQVGIRAGYFVNERALNIDTTFEGVEEATVDLYGAVRNAYLQKRIKAIKE